MRVRLALALAVLAAACTRTPAPGCPSGYHADPVRSERVFRTLAHDSEARPFVDRHRASVSVCYSPRAPGVIAERTLLLDADADDTRLAARAAHLLLHLDRGETSTTGHPSDPRERAALELESRVHARAQGR
jgi:hypothetical protein